MPALDTVGQIVDYARVLLQDTIGGIDAMNPVETYRYPTEQLIDILNFALMDARRIRADLFLTTPTEVPFYTFTGVPAVDSAQPVLIDQQYRLALVYFVVGQAHLRDEEDTQDARASAMMLKFNQMLTDPVTVTR